MNSTSRKRGSIQLYNSFKQFQRYKIRQSIKFTLLQTGMSVMIRIQITYLNRETVSPQQYICMHFCIFETPCSSKYIYFSTTNLHIIFMWAYFTLLHIRRFIFIIYGGIFLRVAPRIYIYARLKKLYISRIWTVLTLQYHNKSCRLKFKQKTYAKFL